MTTDPLDRLIMLNGLRFHFRDWGNDSAQTLVLLHGYTSHARSWDTFARAMCDRFHVLALDQRGHGETQWANDYAPQRMVEDMDAFVRALRLKRFALLGLSMGGRNAYAYTAQHPAEVERLVIVDIGPEVMTSGGARIRQGVLASDVFDTPDDVYRVMRANNQHAHEAELRQRVIYSMMQLDDGRWTYRYDKALRAPDRPLPRPDPEAAWAMLATIACPTLLVRGAESDVLSVETAERMTRVMPHCKLVTVLNAGHSIPLDNPTGFIEAARPFLIGA